MVIMKKLPELTICLLLSSCLAEMYQMDVFENASSSSSAPAPIKSGVFTTSSTDNMLIIKLSSGSFVDSPGISFFQLNNGTMMGSLSRDSDTQVTVIGVPLDNRNDNRLGIAKEAFKTGAKRVTVTSARMGVWKSVGDAAFGSTEIWGVAYGNSRAVAVGGEGKIAYSSDGVTWTALIPGLAEGQSQFENTIRGITFGGGDAGGKFVAVGYDGRMAVSGNGIDWEGWWENNFSGVGGILCVTYGGGAFVAGGGRGKIAYSKDGQVWTGADSKFGEKSIMGLAYGETEKGGVFVAVGTDGQLAYCPDDELAYSSDSKGWKYVDAQFDHNTDGSSHINAVAFGGGMFVAVGNAGKMSYSQNGETWTSIAPGSEAGVSTTFTSSTGILSIAYGSGSFVAVGHNGRMATSVDGVVWTGGSLSDLSGVNDGKIQTICYAGDKFIAAGNIYAGNTSRIAYGFGVPGVEDILLPIDIESRPFESEGTENTLTITLSGSAFKSSFSLGDISLFELNGSPLTSGSIAIESNTRVVLSGLTTIVKNTDNILIVKAGSLISRTSNTPKATVEVSKADWTLASTNFGNSDMLASAYGNGKFIVGGNNVLAYSSDGATWTRVSLSKNDALGPNQIYKDNFTIRSIAYGDNKFVAVGYQNDDTGTTALVLRSTDGAIWRQSEWGQTGFADTSVLAVSYGGGRFVIGGDPQAKNGQDKAKTAWSTDGENWTFVANTSFDNETILSLAYGDGRFVAVGTKGRVAWSKNGEMWSGTTDGGWVSNNLFGDSSDVSAITFAGGKFVAVGNIGSIKTSSDGYEWSEGKDGKFNNTGILGIAYGNGTFVAVGHNGKMSKSTDGETWTAVPSGVSGTQFDDGEKITAIATNGTRFVIIGNKYTGNQSKVVHSN
ncbi:MAG: hypothetical protein LBG05_10340 [Treponema sp.]|jgi:hypothetical protein|nr:hypothetical protein [Treponema sp.]